MKLYRVIGFSLFIGAGACLFLLPWFLSFRLFAEMFILIISGTAMLYGHDYLGPISLNQPYRLVGLMLLAFSGMGFILLPWFFVAPMFAEVILTGIVGILLIDAEQSFGKPRQASGYVPE